MKKMKDLRDLLLLEGSELYNCNQQELNELPNMERWAVSNELKGLIRKQLERTEKEQEFLSTAFKNLNAEEMGRKDKATKSILSESRELIEEHMERDLRDAGLIRSLQILRHRKIAGYGTSAAYARAIGEEKAARYFHDALEEEKRMDREFTDLAERECNKMAFHPELS
jgi:ferritin-like metal-binding protein YciE